MVTQLQRFLLSETEPSSTSAVGHYTVGLGLRLVKVRAKPQLVYLNYVAVGVFGIGADPDTKERLGSVRTRNHLQNIHEVVLVPRTSNVPASDLQVQSGGDDHRTDHNTSSHW